MSTASALLVIASFAIGQSDGPPSNYEHLEELEYFVGHWKAEGTAPDGQGFTMHRSAQWVLNKNFLAEELVAKVGDRQVWASMGMIGWDPTEKKIKQWTANASGGLGETLWTQDGNGGTGKYSGVAGDGRLVTATHTVESTSDDEITYEITDLKMGDNTLPKMTFEYTRTESSRSPQIADTEEASENYDRVKHDDYFVGQWTGQGSLPWGQEFMTDVSTKWVLNKNFLWTEFTAKIDDQVVFENRALRGWDPSASQIKEWSFNSWGGVGEAVVTREGDKKRVFASMGVGADGQQVTSKAVVTIEDDDTYTTLTTDQVIGGQPMGDVRAEYKRQ